MQINPIANSKLDDASLMQLLALKEEDALSNLYDRYVRLVYSIAVKSIGDRDASEEIVQDVFTRVWEKAYTYDARIGKVSTWLTSITRNRVIDEIRRENAHPEISGEREFEIFQSDSPNSREPEVETELSWLQKSVREALKTLSPNERELLTLAYFKGYSHSNIAQLLGIPLGTVKTRVRLARQKLRLILSRTMTDSVIRGD